MNSMPHEEQSEAPVPKKKQAWDKKRTKELFKRYKLHGDERARDALIESHQNLVRYLAYKYAKLGEPIEDLIQVGNLALIGAVDRFDIDRKLEFTTFATPTIEGEIKRYFRDKGWSVKVPRRLKELSAKVTKTATQLTQDLQRTPTYEEIAEHLGESVENVLEAMEASGAYSSVPLEAENSGEDDAPGIIDRYSVEDKALVGSIDRLMLQSAVASLTPKEQEFIRLRFIDGLTQVEIAERMEISQVQVSRLQRRTLKRLQEKIDPDNTMY